MLFLVTVTFNGGLFTYHKPLLHIVVVITDEPPSGNRIRYHTLLQSVALSPISYQRITEGRDYNI